MNHLLPLLLVALLPLGCTRDVASQPKKKAAVVEIDNTGVALEHLRQATGIGSYRDSLRLLGPVLEKQADQLRLTADQRTWLEKSGLGSDDLAEIETKTFRPLDAHHLETSAVFRDAARTLEISGLDEREQAKIAIDWVDRRVLLHQHGQQGLPAAYVLRAGYGGPGDRAAVMIAMLHQMQLGGCVLTLPGEKEPTLVAVLVKKDAYLFDPRTGRPVPTADGAEIATWKQLRDQPELGKFVDLDPKDIARLETRIMAPLESLSPRMEFLERLVQGDEGHVGGNRIGLFVDVVSLDRAGVEAGLPPAKLWNPSPEVGPLFALRRFLPVEDGGLDKTNRLGRFVADQVPSGPVQMQYWKLGLLGDPNIPVEKLKIDELLKMTETLFGLYYGQPQEMLVRGKTESMPRRLDRIRTLLEDAENADGGNDQRLMEAAATWRKRANEAYLALVRNEPSASDQVGRLWNEEALGYLLRPEREMGQMLAERVEMRAEKEKEAAPRLRESQILTRLILSAIREPMAEQANFLLAGLSQDRAERAEAIANRQRQQKKDTKVADENAAKAWKQARSGWNHYTWTSNLGPKQVELKLDAIRRDSGNLDMFLVSLEHLQFQLHRYASARMQLARAQERLGVDVKEELALLAAEFEPIARKDGPIGAELNAVANRLGRLQEAQREPLARRLDILRRDFGDNGSFAWTIREIRAMSGERGQ